MEEVAIRQFFLREKLATVTKETNDFRNLEVPLVVSSLRESDHMQVNEVYTVDVLLNPRHSTICSSNNIFKAQLTKLGEESMQE